MELVRKGSDNVFVVGPLNCCFPVGTFGSRNR
jgi:hypothetical protein